MGRLNPYTWGADSVKGVIETTRLHLSDNEEDHEKAEKITRESRERFNNKGKKGKR